MDQTEKENLSALDFVAVRMEKGTDVAVLLDSIQGIYYGDKGDILEAFASKRLYAIRAKQTPNAIKMKRNPVFCRCDGTGCSALTLPIVYTEDDREREWYISTALKSQYPLLYQELKAQFGFEE